jgi:serine/threonine protein kinase
MDFVDDEHAELMAIESLGLAEADVQLLQGFAERFAPLPVRGLIIARGLSSATKVVLKPQSLFPILVKLDDTEDIRKEEAGDRLIRDRTPPLSIPPIEGVRYAGGRAAIAYRYVTGGRIRHIIRRLDTELSKLSPYRVLQIIDDIFDVILKKCHWLDGRYELMPINLPEKISDFEVRNDAQWDELRAMYDTVKSAARSLRAPHAIVHGDLHAKNVLITRDDAPVLIDFAFAAEKMCQYQDYAKLESTLQFQCDGAIAEQMWRNEQLIYGPTPLIVPHSNTKLAACIHRTRSNLWQGCTRKALQMSCDEVDAGYRSFLIYHLVRLYGRDNNNRDTKQRAYHQAMALFGGFPTANTVM